MEREDRLAAVIAEWYAARDSAHPIDPDALLRAHPDLADDLQLHFRLADVIMGGSEPATRAAQDAPPATARRANDVPERVGAYRIMESLGSGGMGVVYRADVVEASRASVAGDRVAIKVVHPHLMRSPGFFRRFLREAELGSEVRHPNVVRTLDFDAQECDGRVFHFLVMEYVEGSTLRELVDELTRVPEELCRHIGHEVAQGLAAIHAVGAVHRDVKPENVLITADHQVKVMDLGVAHVADDRLRLSQTGAFIGSVEYAAPEQFGDADVDHRIDLHGLGLLLYELASGHHPYRADDYRVVMRNVLSGKPRRLGDANPQVSPFFEELVHVLLATDRDARFHSASRVAEILAQGEHSVWWGQRARSLREVSQRPLRRIRIPRETAVYGRDAELATLQAAYADACDGRGRVVLVSGEAGIGKTRIIDEFVARLQADGRDPTFVFGSYPPGGAATAAGAFSTAFREQLGDEQLEDAAARYLAATPRLVAPFVALLRGDALPAGAHALSKESLQTVFVEVLRGLAAERPTIVLIDDLHFAPEEGRALFSALTHAVAGHRVLLLGTHRPGVPEDWRSSVSRLDHAASVGLHRLGPKDLVRLLEDSFRSRQLAEDLAGRIAVKSDGNPFFVFEIIRGLREGQLLRKQADGTWASTQVIRDIQIPSSVLDLIQARTADLSQDERNLLEVAACQGFDFDGDVLSEVLGLARVPALQILGRVEKAHRLVRASGRRFAFDHHQVQEALYGGLSEPLREEYHAAIGDVLERRLGAVGGRPGAEALVVDVCEHMFSGVRPERGVPYVERALTHLQQGYMHERTVDLVERALRHAHVFDTEAQLELIHRKGRALRALARWEDENAAFRETLRLAEEIGDPWKIARARVEIVANLFARNRYDEARELLEPARAILDETDDPALRGMRARVHGSLAVLQRAIRNIVEAEVQFRKSLALSDEAGDHDASAITYGHLAGIATDRGRPEEARRLLEAGLELSRRQGMPDNEARCLDRLGTLAWHLGDFAAARESYRAATDAARRCGARQAICITLVNTASNSFALGEFDDALRAAREGAQLAAEIGNEEMIAAAAGNAGMCMLGLGRLDEGQRLLVDDLERSRRSGSAYGLVYSQMNYAFWALAVGENDLAQELIDRSRAAMEELALTVAEGDILYIVGSLEERRGDRDRAIAALERCIECAIKAHKTWTVAEAHAVLGGMLVEAGRPDDARRALQQGLELGRERGFQMAITLSLCWLAQISDAHVAEALSAVEEFETRLVAHDRMTARWLLWRATADRRHLVTARALLDVLLANSAPERRPALIENVPANRAVAEATGLAL